MLILFLVSRFLVQLINLNQALVGPVLPNRSNKKILCCVKIKDGLPHEPKFGAEKVIRTLGMFSMMVQNQQVCVIA